MNDIIKNSFSILTGLLIVSIYFLPVMSPDDGLVNPFWFIPMSLIPVMGLLAWYLSLKNKRCVPVYGLRWLIVVFISIIFSLFAHDFDPLTLRRCLFSFLPFLLIPLVFQLVTSTRGRQSLQAIAIGLLAVTLYEIALQQFIIIPNLQQMYQEAPQSVAQALGINFEDKYAFEDLKARINGGELYGHFIHSNILSIALILLGAIAFSIKRYVLALISFLFVLNIFSLGPILCAMAGLFIVLFYPKLNKFNLKVVVCVALVFGFLMSHVDANRLIKRTSQYDVMKSITFRLSYWQTARQMTERHGPVGLGKYDKYAEMCRAEGGHYSNTPHNIFLKLTAELGIIAAIASLLWFSKLFSGEFRISEDQNQSNKFLIIGALIGFAVVVFTDFSQFHMGYMISKEHQLIQRWPYLDLIVKLIAIFVFYISMWGALHSHIRINKKAYIFASVAFLIHIFIDSAFVQPSVIMIVSLFVALGWKRMSRQVTIAWHLFPVISLVTITLLFVVQHNQRNKRLEDPYYLEKIFVDKTIETDQDIDKQQAFMKWHQNDLSAVYPLWQLMVSSKSEMRRQWVLKCLSARPSDPSHQLAVAHWLFQMGESPDLVRNILDHIDVLIKKGSLDRYKLGEEELKIFNEMRLQLISK